MVVEEEEDEEEEAEGDLMLHVTLRVTYMHPGDGLATEIVTAIVTDQDFKLWG